MSAPPLFRLSSCSHQLPSTSSPPQPDPQKAHLELHSLVPPLGRHILRHDGRPLPSFLGVLCLSLSSNSLSPPSIGQLASGRPSNSSFGASRLPVGGGARTIGRNGLSSSSSRGRETWRAFVSELWVVVVIVAVAFRLLGGRASGSDYVRVTRGVVGVRVGQTRLGTQGQQHFRFGASTQGRNARRNLGS